MKSEAKRWILKKLGIYDYVWQEFCEKFPVRISADTPEMKHFMDVQGKVFQDMLVYGMGATQYVDPSSLMRPIDKSMVN